jgi:tetratricopeptide (TPR) repeat protein
MKKITLFAVTMLAFMFLSVSCLSSPSTDGNSTKQDTTSNTKDSPDVEFVKKVQTLLNKGDYKQAIALFDNMPSQLKNNQDLQLILASLYFSDSQYDAAKEVAEKVLVSDPDNMEALELLSLIAKSTGDKKTNSEINAKILTKDPYNTSINIQQAEDYVLNHKYKLAKNSYKKALQNDPENKDALFGYAQMSYYSGDVKEASEIFQQIINDDKTNYQALAYLGKIAAEDQNYLRAQNYVQEAIKYNPTSYDAYLDLGSYLRYQGKYEDAIKAWNKATELDSGYFLGYAYLAGIYDEQNNYNKAIENYHKVIETNPKYFYAYEACAVLEFHEKQYESAQKNFQKAYSYSKNYSYQLMIAAIYLIQKDSINAKKVLSSLLKTLNRDSAEYDLVRFFNESYSKNAEATLIQKIEKTDDRNAKGKMLFYMGLYYEINGFSENAFEYYSKVIKMQAPMFFEYRFAEWGIKE